MNLVMVGMSYKTAPVEMRERVSLSEGMRSEALLRLIGYTGVREAVIVSTCNRMEIYVTSYASDIGTRAIMDLLTHGNGISSDELAPFLYIKIGDSVVAHLFEVVCSLDSMVLGEAQIQGQVREAYKQAEAVGATSELLNRVFRQALSVGKRVRSTTAIGAHSVSLSTAAVTLAKRVFDTLEGRSVLVVGAGETSELTARYLAESGVESVMVANRTFDHAQAIAHRFGGQAIRLDDIENRLAHADIVISSTAAPGYVIKQEMVERAARRRDTRPLLLIDIALPRDIDPACGGVGAVYLYDVDDLEGIIESHKEGRSEEARKAGAIIAEEVESYKQWYQTLSVRPTIRHIRQKADRIAEAEVERAFKRIDSLTDEDRAVVEAMAAAIVKKLLHGPTARLQKQASNPDAYYITESAQYLFGLESNPDGVCVQHCERCGRYEVVRMVNSGEQVDYDEVVPPGCAYLQILQKAVEETAQRQRHEKAIQGGHHG